MTFDLARILEGKRVLRRTLAARSVAEKLRLLDRLRERALDIRKSGILREKLPRSRGWRK